MFWLVKILQKVPPDCCLKSASRLPYLTPPVISQSTSSPTICWGTIVPTLPVLALVFPEIFFNEYLTSAQHYQVVLRSCDVNTLFTLRPRRKT